MGFYTVTAHKPSVVSHSLVGHFTATGDLNLIIGKCTVIEIHKMGPEGIVPVIEVPINGRISCMELFRPPNENKDLLYIATERYRMCILAYENGEIVTRASGDIHDRIGKPTENGQIGIIDPLNRVIAMHLYEGMLKVIPFDLSASTQQQQQTRVKDAFNLRLEEMNIIDIKFLHGYQQPTSAAAAQQGIGSSSTGYSSGSSSSAPAAQASYSSSIDVYPTIAVLHEDTRNARHIKTYQINIQEKDFLEGPFQQPNVEPGATHLIPVPAPLGGLIILGEETITYHDGSVFRSLALDQHGPTSFRAYGSIDLNGERWLLGDHRGWLFVLRLDLDATRRTVIGLQIQKVGETSISSTITYLDDGYVFVGSTYGDSQLVKLSATADMDTGAFLEVIGTYANLGPVIDFCVVDIEKQGQGQVVTCSGGLKDGSLRIVRNGIGIEEHANIELDGIKGLWSVKGKCSSNNTATEDRFVVITFIGATRAMGFDDEGDLGEIEVPGLDSERQTLRCQTTASGASFVQVTEAEVRLIDTNTLKLITAWKPSSAVITAVAANVSGQIVVSLGQGNLVSLELAADGKQLKQVGQCTLANEVACIDLSPLAKQQHAELCAVGMWKENNLRLLRLPGLDSVQVQPLEVDVLPRSMLLTTFEDVDYVLCALGDGQLFSYKLDRQTYQLFDKKKISLGTKPTLLTAFGGANGNVDRNVFAASDRPTVIYSSNKKLLFSNVNLKEVSFVCEFNNAQFPGGLAIAKENSLSFGSIDEIQKLHIRALPLYEQPKRVCFHEETSAFAIATVRNVVDTTSNMETEVCYLRLINSQTFDFSDEYKLDPQEHPGSILSTKLYSLAGDDHTAAGSSTAANNMMAIEKTAQEYIVLGTAYVTDEEDEPTRGRILVFEVRDEKLSLVAEKEVRGAVYCLAPFNGKLLAGVNSRVHLFKWNQQADMGFELAPECHHAGHVIALTLQSRGNFIIVGDLMRSISLLNYNAVDGALEEIARDYNTSWVTATEMLDLDNFIGAENQYNLYTLQRNLEATSEEERRKLIITGTYHLGDMVNKFQHGSLVMRAPEGPAAGVSASNHADDGDTVMSGTTTTLRGSQQATVDDRGVPKIEGNQLSTLLYGTVSGALGVVATLPDNTFQFFLGLQNALNQVVKGVGNLSHEAWRSYSTERTREKSKNFVDGDLVESFLDLNGQKKKAVLAAFKQETGNDKITVDDLVKVIEELQLQLH